MRILMAASELAPLAKTGGLADVLGALPRALAHLGHHVTVVLPFYRSIRADRYGISRIGDWFDAWVGGDHLFGGLHRWDPEPGVTVFLVAQDELFGRSSIYGENGGAYDDNHRRFIFLSLATVEVARRMVSAGQGPDVFHGHDWHVGLVPVYLKEGRAGRVIPSVFSIHNLQYQGRFGRDVLHEAGLSDWYYHTDRLELYGSVAFMKAGLVYADMISTVSRAYAREIQTPAYGEGLDGLLRSRSEDLVGIVNGIDVNAWNPARDAHLAAHFWPGAMQGKDRCKKALQIEFKLPVRSEVPLIAMVSRLVDQKGIDLVGAILPGLLANDVQIVIVGSGEHKYESMLQHYGWSYPHQMGVRIGFDEGLAHRVEAGADLFLMPSKFEPCGLNQMYSLRYGTVPVVRKVGGLDDTVTDFDPYSFEGNGFKFEHYDANGLWWALGRALRTWHDRPLWERFRESIMNEDFSWEHAAKEYVQLYERARAP